MSSAWQQRQLLTSRKAATAALILTLFVWAMAVHGMLHPTPAQSEWMTKFNWTSYPWLNEALTVGFYFYLCWATLWIIRGAKGAERLFLAGWLIEVVLSPLRLLGPQWVLVTQFIGLVGLTVALQLALLLALTLASRDSD